jgi:hypothetical protein
MKKSNSEFVSEFINRSVYPVEEYKGCSGKIKFCCRICDNEWRATTSNVSHGSGCPSCNGGVKKSNIIHKDHGTWLEVDISTKMYPNKFMKIDKSDLHLITGKANFGKIGYAFFYLNGKRVTVHSIINKAFKRTDHVSRDKLDNRRENLRECTQSQNMANASLRSDNTSGHRGIGWDKRRNKWVVCLYMNRSLVFCKRFKHLSSAILARKIAETIHFGEYAPKYNVIS